MILSLELHLLIHLPRLGCLTLTLTLQVPGQDAADDGWDDDDGLMADLMEMQREPLLADYFATWKCNQVDAKPVAEGDEGEERVEEDGIDSRQRVQRYGRGDIERWEGEKGCRMELRSAFSKTNSMFRSKTMGSMANRGELKFMEPYYEPATRYEGMPSYMTVDTSEHSEATVAGWADAVTSRIGSYDIKTNALEGAGLNTYNMKHYNMTHSPREFPLKIGQWVKVAKASAKKSKRAAAGKSSSLFSKFLAWASRTYPDDPTYYATTPLLLAVRMCRLECVDMLLKLDTGALNAADGWGCRPIDYAMYLYSKDKPNPSFNYLVDLLLAQGPEVNPRRPPTFEDEPKKAKKSKSWFVDQAIMYPMVLAVLCNDKERVAHLVTRLGANADLPRIFLPNVCAYQQGLFENLPVKRTLSCVLPLQLATILKNFDMVKLLLQLGADPNSVGVPKDAAKQTPSSEKLVSDMTKTAEMVDEAPSGFDAIVGAVKMMKDMAVDMIRPHAWATAMHFAARGNASDITILLIKNGALMGGVPINPVCKRKTPLVEAMAYGRKNMTVSKTEHAQEVC